MWAINNRKIFYGISGALVLASIVLFAVWGFNVGIDFTGGSLLEASYEEGRPDIEAIRSEVSEIGFGDIQVQPTGENGVIVRTRSITEEERQDLLSALSFGGEFSPSQERFTSIGPTIGSELRRKAMVAIAIVVILIILFVAYAFRRAGREVSSWSYGLIAITALVHDIIIPTGIFTALGHFLGGYEIDALFVTALLAILGYSVNDTIVVFDRVRENLISKDIKGSFEEIAGKSLSQTITRSINTSVTTLLVLLALYFVGAEATKNFALVMIIGVISGTYSSIFLATPLLVTWKRWRDK